MAAAQGAAIQLRLAGLQRATAIPVALRHHSTSCSSRTSSSSSSRYYFAVVNGGLLHQVGGQHHLHLHKHKKPASCIKSASSISTARLFSSNAVPVQSQKGADREDESKIPKPPQASQPQMMTPPELAAELDKFVIGQADAKRAMASAIRFRWRRKQLNEQQREDCNPRNILMIGPTGCGKTEIARRLAKIVDAPFVIAEATKFTEVGFHGRDIESVMRDLMEAGIKMVQKKLEKEYTPMALEVVDEKLLEALLGDLSQDTDRVTWRGHLRKGWLDERTVFVDVPVTQTQSPGGILGAPSGGMASGSLELGDIYRDDRDLNRLTSAMGGGRGVVRTEKKKLTIREARKKLLRAELDARITQEELIQRALKAVEEDGIVFLDEIDKIVSPKGSYGPDASSEGVQRDLLPIIEGTTINTKYGNIKSNHVLFVCAGSFHAVRPSDMLAELQGRLPVKIKLHPLTEGDFYRILSEPEFGIIEQNVALLGTEGATVEWSECGIREVARLATEMNTYIENTGARRLHTIVEQVTDDLSFNIAEYKGKKVLIDRAFVESKTSTIEIDKTARGLL
ncbi:unnamed protein product [Amoebophrya sp. A25]|nr:unnamed protein product [Amoebophrya sp. A25]|eukprot:GSA25T00019956001.1